jgi:hypothetical protein
LERQRIVTCLISSPRGINIPHMLEICPMDKQPLDKINH